MLQCLVVKFEAETVVQTVLESLGRHLRNRKQGFLDVFRLEKRGFGQKQY